MANSENQNTAPNQVKEDEDVLNLSTQMENSNLNARSVNSSAEMEISTVIDNRVGSPQANRPFPTRSVAPPQANRPFPTRSVAPPITRPHTPPPPKPSTPPPSTPPPPPPPSPASPPNSSLRSSFLSKTLPVPPRRPPPPMRSTPLPLPPPSSAALRTRRPHYPPPTPMLHSPPSDKPPQPKQGNEPPHVINGFDYLAAQQRTCSHCGESGLMRTVMVERKGVWKCRHNCAEAGW